MRLAALLLVLPVSLLAQRPTAAPAAPPKWDAAVDAFTAFVTYNKIVGGGLAFVRDGTVRTAFYTGSADRTTATPADARSVWHWASITKTLTAIATMQLVERKLVALDDPVTKWVPELRRIHNPYGSMDQITVRMLLSHSSGLQNGTWPWTKGEPWEPFEPTEWAQLVAMMPYMKVNFPPGSRYSYSNPGFIYLARIIEAVTGDPWESYVQKNLFSPLDLRTSYFNATPYHLAKWRSNNYSLQKDGVVRENGRDFNPGVTIPNGGWNAPIGDLATWAGFLMGAAPGNPDAAARYDGVLSRRLLESMWEPVVTAGTEQMGLSFFVAREGDRRFVGHTGSQAGFRSFIYVDPVRRTAIIGVVNTDADGEPTGYQEGFRAAMRAGIEVLKAAP